MSHENKRRPQSISEECMTENATQLDPFEWHHLNDSKFALDDMRVMVNFSSFVQVMDCHMIEGLYFGIHKISWMSYHFRKNQAFIQHLLVTRSFIIFDVTKGVSLCIISS